MTNNTNRTAHDRMIKKLSKITVEDPKLPMLQHVHESESYYIASNRFMMAMCYKDNTKNDYTRIEDKEMQSLMNYTIINVKANLDTGNPFQITFDKRELLTMLQDNLKQLNKVHRKSRKLVNLEIENSEISDYGRIINLEIPISFELDLPKIDKSLIANSEPIHSTINVKYTNESRKYQQPHSDYTYDLKLLIDAVDLITDKTLTLHLPANSPVNPVFITSSMQDILLLPFRKSQRD